MDIEQKKEKPRVVLDTNVILSGLNFRGETQGILVRSRSFLLAISFDDTYHLFCFFRKQQLRFRIFLWLIQ